MVKANIHKKLERIEEALLNLAKHEIECRLCPRECGINREKEEKGFCNTGSNASISHAILHFGEEPVLSGYYDCIKDKLKDSKHISGSGTIFFSGCNLKCSFCQNYQLSWLNQGKPASHEELALNMLNLQKKGALNINAVSPTHIILPLLKSLKIAYSNGLELPLVYNSNGYEKAEVIKNLEGIVDIYLPDFKYHSPELAEKFSGAADYFQHASLAIKEMFRQQPALLLDDQEIAQKGLIVRHLILPCQITDSFAILEWIAQNLSKSVCLSLMSQYQPSFKAPPEIQRQISFEEYNQVKAKAEELGFETMFIQSESFAPHEHLTPDFNRKDPFLWE